jgi:uncharacterized membrane protein
MAEAALLDRDNIGDNNKEPRPRPRTWVALAAVVAVAAVVVGMILRYNARTTSSSSSKY